MDQDLKEAIQFIRAEMGGTVSVEDLFTCLCVDGFTRQEIEDCVAAMEAEKS
jgi:hypothetical protein